MSDPDGHAGNTWAEFLRSARRAKGWSIDELAAKAEVSRMTIMRWEAGASGFKHETLERVARVLDIPRNLAYAVASGEMTVQSLPPPLHPLAAELNSLLTGALPDYERDVLIEILERILGPSRDVARQTAKERRAQSDG